MYVRFICRFFNDERKTWQFYFLRFIYFYTSDRQSPHTCHNANFHRKIGLASERTAAATATVPKWYVIGLSVSNERLNITSLFSYMPLTCGVRCFYFFIYLFFIFGLSFAFFALILCNTKNDLKMISNIKT